MTTTDDTTTVRLTGRRGLLAAIPAMLGFHPEESLVMVCLSGPKRRVGPVIRVDLAAPGVAVLVSQFQRHAERYADEVALLCYTERPGCCPVLDEVLDGLESGGARI